MAIDFFVCDCYNIGGGCLGRHTGDSLEVYDFLASISSLKKLRRLIEFGGMIKSRSSYLNWAKRIEDVKFLLIYGC